MDVLSAILHRQSVRAFLDKPVTQEQVGKILEVAKWAPSGVDTQPWEVVAVAGTVKTALCQALVRQFETQAPHTSDYHYYPQDWFEPYKSRRKACGLALYSALHIGFEETEKRKVAWRRNYEFFGAPVGLLFFVDGRLEKGSWVDVGLFLQNVMLAARGFGLETCPQASIAEYPDIVRTTLQVDASKHLVCGMALGFADWDHPLNQYRTVREPLSAFAQFRGW